MRSKLIGFVQYRTSTKVLSPTFKTPAYFCIMIQVILIGVVFLGAAFYLGRMAVRSFQPKNECASGCGKCAASNMEAQTK